MGWVVRLHVLVFMAVLIDIALVGNAERPERESKHKSAKRKRRTPNAETGSMTSTDDELSDDLSGTNQSSGDDDESSVEVNEASEPCLEAEQEECKDWGKSGFGCVWQEKDEGWCYHKKSTRYNHQKPNLLKIYAEDEGQGDFAHVGLKAKKDDVKAQLAPKGDHRAPLLAPLDDGEYNLNGSDDFAPGSPAQRAAPHNGLEAPIWKPNQPFTHAHYQLTKDVGMQVGQLVSNAAHQVKHGLHPKADEAKYQSDIYHNTLHDFDRDLRAYKQGVANFRQSAAAEHKAKTKSLREELVKSPTGM